MKYFVIILFFLSSFVVAQTKEVEFNVVKPKVEFTITPTYNHLYQHIAHSINISIEDTSHTYIVKLAGGSINETDTGTYITPEAKSEAILNIYEVKNGYEILVGIKKFNVLPEPLPYLRGKPTDNVLMDMLLVSGTLKGVSLYQRKKVVLPVKSFTVVYKDETNSFKSVDVVGNQIPVPIRKEISTLSNGSLIYFENINVELLPNYNVLIQPYRVTMEIVEGKDVTNFGIGE